MPPLANNEKKLKREIILLWILKILPKVNQVIYTLDTIYDLNTCIMALAKAVLEIICSQASFGYDQNRKTFSHGFREFYKKLIRSSTPRIQPVNQIS